MYVLLTTLLHYYRFGHSQISDYQGVFNSKYQFVEKVPIENTYHCPHMAVYEGGMQLPGIARWLIGDSVPLADGYVLGV